MTAIGALFDSSRQLINGPTNAISIALLSALAMIPTPDKIPAAITMALFVGLIQLGITLLRLGDLTRYISHAVLVGFTVGAAVLLVLDQFSHLLGLVPQGTPGDHFLRRFWLTIAQIAHLDPWTIVIGCGTISIVLGVRWLKRRGLPSLFPEFLVAV